MRLVCLVPLVDEDGNLRVTLVHEEIDRMLEFYRGSVVGTKLFVSMEVMGED